MRAAAGLLGYLAPAGLPPQRLQEAARRSPWRGPVATSYAASFGAIHAFGQAAAAEIGSIAVALHGRIDNLSELGRALTVDPAEPCAVVAAAYRHYGDDFGRHLLGDFALLVLDRERRVVLGARDWLGTRPLFWGQLGDLVAFGSEVKQVLALLDLPCRPNEAALQGFADMGYPPYDATFVEGVSAVPPYGQVVAALGRPPRFSQTASRFEPIDIALPEAARLVRQRLEVAVSRRTAGATRLGALVSGGLDSTSVAATAASLAARSLGPLLHAAFTMAFPTVPECDETAYAREVAEMWHVPWLPVPLYPNHDSVRLVSAFGLHDGPTFPGDNWESLLKCANDLGIDVLLTGQIGDWWLEQAGQGLRLSILRSDWLGAARWAPTEVRRDPILALKKIGRALEGRFFRGERAEAHFERAEADFWLRFALESEERTGMQRGIQFEFPMTDRELASVLAGLPPRLRSRPGVTKCIMRSSMGGLLPKSVLGRRTETKFDSYLQAEFGAAAPAKTVLQTAAHRNAVIWRRMISNDGGQPEDERSPCEG